MPIVKTPALKTPILKMQATGADFDVSGRYRYRLWRGWNLDRPRLAFIMLNPSTADAETNDPTIRRCIQFAHAWGYGAIEVVNLFALRATCPKVLQTAAQPIGPHCDRAILTAVTQADQTVIAWGNWGHLQGRDRSVLSWLLPNYALLCLGKTQSGQPRHPLYLSRTTLPVLFTSSIKQVNSSSLESKHSPDLALHHEDNVQPANNIR